MIDDNAEKKADAGKEKPDVGKKMGYEKTDTGKAKASHKK